MIISSRNKGREHRKTMVFYGGDGTYQKFKKKLI